MTKITGKGFSTEELSNTERAQYREMFREFEAERPIARPFWGVLRSFRSLAATAGILGALGVVVAWAVKQGFFQ